MVEQEIESRLDNLKSQVDELLDLHEKLKLENESLRDQQK